ncbi:helix-turn-helix transcriptional regulator [Haloechinothrix sp. LS1_15]|uniref:helix-turn-helix transcriptional regulator n=1 Tax=Haloechinothrix sp. LS1_15 TaxID=2652248 RepID=UPI00294469E9|nr:helix-turn-helix transcriptional regulator [Haloechinothrix sp. LS1_15]MDV6013652.1 helix-turn-helix transcriptional regulator [Haloechinothrix sp. LS1_15]
MRIDSQRYQQILGDELRKARKRRGWTRKELNQRLDRDVSIQTLATYELGTRQCSVVRLAEICLAMGETPHDLLGRVHARLFSTGADQIEINLVTVAHDPRPELHPLRRWAADRLRDEGTFSHPYVYLAPAAVERLAELCDVPPHELREYLRTLSNPVTSNADGQE